MCQNLSFSSSPQQISVWFVFLFCFVVSLVVVVFSYWVRAVW